MSEIFGGEWAAAMARELEASTAYREAARDWEGSLTLELEPEEGSGEPTRAVLLDLRHGRCREARPVGADGRARADYRIAGAGRTWHRVLSGELDPLLALATGRLQLRRGRLSELVGWGEAARELLRAARRAGGTLPEASA